MPGEPAPPGPASAGPRGGSPRQGFAPAPANLAGAVLLVLIAVVWSWWASKYGGYFGTVMYPGLALLCVAVILVVQRPDLAGARLRLPTAARVALTALLGLGAWSALSGLWSPSPDVAVADAQRILGYGVAFALGVWLCALVRTRMHLAMVPLAAAGLFAGILTLVEAAGADGVGRLLDAGTLEYPLGYRNANAAFFFIAAWPAVGLAATPRLDWRLRAISIGAATLCLELAMLSQSRGSILAAAVALMVFVGISRDRARSVAWLLIALVPALIVVSPLADLFEAARQGTRGETVDALHAAARASALGVALAVAVGAVATLAGRRLRASETALARANRAVAIGTAGLLLAGVAGFVVATGDPIDWIDARAEEFRQEGSPDLSGSSSRLATANAGSERHDLWRVAVQDLRADPLLGDGGGGFHYSYLRRRGESGLESARDAHSVELEVASELGVPGLLLLLTALAAAAAGAWRARSVSAAAAALSACALTAGAYWLTHASLDWFWAYPGITAPVFALLGSACAPGTPILRAQGRSRARLFAVAGALVLGLSLLAPYLSERYVDSAFSTWGRDPARSNDDLERARSLNPLSDQPLLAAGAIARARGEREDAIAAFREAAEQRPEEWAVHYLLATLYRDSSPRKAAAELAIAAELNPLSRRLEGLRERMEAASAGRRGAPGR